MFLLNLPYQRLFLTLHLPLHPIMFLLNPHISLFSAFVTSFTSHYVPIKSNSNRKQMLAWGTLHPIMFLLNRHRGHEKRITKRALHPIMFLLNQYRK